MLSSLARKQYSITYRLLFHVLITHHVLDQLENVGPVLRSCIPAALVREQVQTIAFVYKPRFLVVYFHIVPYPLKLVARYCTAGIA